MKLRLSLKQQMTAAALDTELLLSIIKARCAAAAALLVSLPWPLSLLLLLLLLSGDGHGACGEHAAPEAGWAPIKIPNLHALSALMVPKAQPGPAQSLVWSVVDAIQGELQQHILFATCPGGEVDSVLLWLTDVIIPLQPIT